MELTVAETITRAARNEAEQRARDDLDQLRKRAVAAGRQRSRKIIKVTAINETTGSIRHLPTGRLLRDWYVHVYINTLRANLSQPYEPIDAQQVEDTAAILRRARPNAEPRSSLQAVGVVRDIAFADASTVAARMTERLQRTGEGRAINYAPDDRFDGDQLRVHVTRHWYKRCYDNVVDGAVMARHPLAAVTDAEQLEVAKVMANREVRRLIGRDNIPLVTAHGTKITEVDRGLASGEVGLVPALPPRIGKVTNAMSIEDRIREAWNDMPRNTRQHWLRLAAVSPTSTRASWGGLDESKKAALVEHYRMTYLPDLADTRFRGQLIKEPDAEAARQMFNHPATLIAPAAGAAGPGRPESASEVAVDDVVSRTAGVHRHRSLIQVPATRPEYQGTLVFD
ncbi:hypothetical protein FOE78_04585 [Microlunatus elymi]|uniref:Uncharacterized protein n=1 Tax=Microlunatus elymi TaxID=2596828 RepID=A0A516PVU0_9ACTN|nr:hypothetical protein [Microlunatus elymi]QDP95280.1 hypothetical protein FOE78_04585 [Microlunatus elymi]